MYVLPARAGQPEGADGVPVFTGSSQHTRTVGIEEALDWGVPQQGADRFVAHLAVLSPVPNRENGRVHTSLPSPAHTRRMTHTRLELGR